MEFHPTFEKFARDHAVLPREDFVQRYRNPLLVIDLVGVDVLPPDFKAYAATSQGDHLTAFVDGGKDRTKVLVVEVVKSDRNRFNTMITLGRASSNDIVVPHQAISKFHAYFQEDDRTGQITFTDAKSKFGSTVNGRPLPPSEPYPLASGAAIVLGRSVHATFYSPKDFFAYMQLMERIRKRGDTQRR